MSKINQPKIPLTLTDNNELIPTVEHRWKLVREGDGLTKYSDGIIWLEWDEKGWFKAQHDYPAVGYALLLSPFNQFFAWQTTDIVEIIEQNENYIKFKTKNSIYELTKI